MLKRYADKKEVKRRQDGDNDRQLVSKNFERLLQLHGFTYEMYAGEGFWKTVSPQGNLLDSRGNPKDEGRVGDPKIGQFYICSPKNHKERVAHCHLFRREFDAPPMSEAKKVSIELLKQKACLEILC